MLLVLKAIDFATKRHAGQVRKVSNLPYITHPVAVSYIVASFKHSRHHEELLTASILHDVLEDTSTTFVELAEQFGPMVSSLVQELTNDDESIKDMGKLEYHKRKLVGMSSYALVIKLADRLHNVMDHPTEKMKADTVQLMTHLKEHRKLSATHLRLVDAITNRVK
jgi:(p)ppGpp synthase/HD superfamily hydrolase